MFPAPVDLGIAQEDRAVCSVPFGTSSYLEGGRGEGERWYEGGGALGERAVAEIVVYPPTRGVQTQGDPFEPVKIGILVDMDLGQLLADWIDPTILALEDALNEGVWGRSPVAIVTCDARGLPRENYRKVIAGYDWLVEQGCVVDPRADDLRQLPARCRRTPTRSACRASAGPARTASPATTASPSPTATSRPRA